MRLCLCIAGLFPVFLAVGATSSILEMTPPIRGLSLANVRDTFEEVHNGRPHEAIDILQPRGTLVRAVVSGTVRKLFLGKPGGKYDVPVRRNGSVLLLLRALGRVRSRDQVWSKRKPPRRESTRTKHRRSGNLPGYLAGGLIAPAPVWCRPPRHQARDAAGFGTGDSPVPAPLRRRCSATRQPKQRPCREVSSPFLLWRSLGKLVPGVAPSVLQRQTRGTGGRHWPAEMAPSPAAAHTSS